MKLFGRREKPEPVVEPPPPAEIEVVLIADETVTRVFKTERLVDGNYAAGYNTGEEREGHWTCPICLFQDNLMDETDFPAGACLNCGWSMRYESP